jgi:hypothetical protein
MGCQLPRMLNRSNASAAETNCGELDEISFTSDADQLIAPLGRRRAVNRRGVGAWVPHFAEGVGPNHHVLSRGTQQIGRVGLALIGSRLHHSTFQGFIDEENHPES